MYNRRKEEVTDMELQLTSRLRGSAKAQWEALLRKTGLEPDSQWDQAALLWDGDNLAATGSRMGNILKCIAVDPAHRGEDLTAQVLSTLRTEAFQESHRHLFLYTKPENEMLFRGLFFHTVASAEKVLLMEDKPQGIRAFLKTLPLPQESGIVGAAVMNCDPFTLGHRYLIETASRECDQVFIFVLSEDRGHFPAKDRLELVRRGTADLTNVTVLPTGPYLISAATFPTYFLKDRDSADTVRCGLDIEIFTRYYAPRFRITRRYVGTEPFSPMTDLYNRALEAALPQRGIQLRLIPRKEGVDGPVSASAVRRKLAAGEDVSHLVPKTTFDYLTQGGF